MRKPPPLRIQKRHRGQYRVDQRKPKPMNQYTVILVGTVAQQVENKSRRRLRTIDGEKKNSREGMSSHELSFPSLPVLSKRERHRSVNCSSSVDSSLIRIVHIFRVAFGGAPRTHLKHYYRAIFSNTRVPTELGRFLSCSDGGSRRVTQSILSEKQNSKKKKR